MSEIKKLDKADRLYIKKDYLKAYSIYKEYAKKENLYAIKIIWTMLLYGKGIKKDINMAYKWCKKAADMGDAKTQYYYANYCFENNDYKKGKFYLDKASIQGDLDAIRYTASNYFFGEFGYIKNEEKALSLYTEACLKGNKGACVDLYFTNKRLVGKIKSASYIRKKIGFFKYFKILFNRQN